MTENKKKFPMLWVSAGIMLILFVLLTVSVMLIDVQPIGPHGSEVGLATLNGEVHDALGENNTWYIITEYSGFAAFAVVGAFGVVGLCQLIKRRSIKKVDADILLLGGAYTVMALAYVAFEIFVVNYRPILIDGELEASFPSSHTMLVVCIMGTAVYQILKRIKKRILCVTCISLAALVSTVTVVGRLLSGVHWFTDIVGGLLLSGALIAAYIAACKAVNNKYMRT